MVPSVSRDGVTLEAEKSAIHLLRLRQTAV